MANLNEIRGVEFAFAASLAGRQLFLGIPQTVALIFPFMSVITAAWATRNFQRYEEIKRLVYCSYFLLPLSILSNAVVLGIFLYELLNGTQPRGVGVHTYCTFLAGLMLVCDVVFVGALRTFEKSLEWLISENKNVE